MKKTLKCLIICIAVVLMVVLILFLLGFRIIYNPNLENSWDAISAIATWVSVIVSGLALLVAIHIPKIIASKQNKIALFERRHEYYIVFCRCIAYAEMINQDFSKSQLRETYVVMLSDNITADRSVESINYTLTPLRYKTVSTMSQGSFLFDFNTDEFIEPLLHCLAEVLSCEDDVNPSKISELKSLALNAKNNLTRKIEDELKLSV